MSRMRVLILAVAIGGVMVIPTPMAAWAGQQAQKVAKQEKNADKKATQHQGEKKKEKERGKKDKKSTGNDSKQEQAGKQKEKKTQKEEKSEKAGDEKVTLCHKLADKSEGARSITVGAAAVDEHLAHGDTKGPCK